MGEPLLNPNVYEAIAHLTNPNRFNISQRRISVSTVGIIPGIQRLSKEFPQVNLAFSLHSPFEQQRARIIPAEKNYPLEEVFNVLDQHIAATKRKVFISYLVMEGENDSDGHILATSSLIKSRPHQVNHLYHVNLLRFNPALDLPFSRASEIKFKRILDLFAREGINIPIISIM